MDYQNYGVDPEVIEAQTAPKCYIHDPDGSALLLNGREPSFYIWCEYRTKMASVGHVWDGWSMCEPPNDTG